MEAEVLLAELGKMMGEQSRSERDLAQALVQQALASQEVNRELRDLRETLTGLENKLESYAAMRPSADRDRGELRKDLNALTAIVKSALDGRTDRRAWFSTVWGPLLVALIGMLSAVVGAVVTGILGKQ